MDELFSFHTVQDMWLLIYARIKVSQCIGDCNSVVTLKKCIRNVWMSLYIYIRMYVHIHCMYILVHVYMCMYGCVHACRHVHMHLSNANTIIHVWTQWCYLSVYVCTVYILMHLISHTVWYLYNTISFLQNPHKRHPIARPLGWGIGCLLWLQTLIYILPQSVQ